MSSVGSSVLAKQQNKWWLLFVTTSSTALVFLDNTVMPVALPTIQKELHLSEVGAVWIVNSYLASLTALLLIGGRLCDLLGKRALFIWGLIIFGLGSLIGGLAQSEWSMMVGRVVQGMGGALTIPTTAALLIATFPEGERAKAMGINTGISSLFLFLGPAIGGFLTQYVSWRSIFFINIPIVCFGIAMALLVLTKERGLKEKFHFSGAFAMFFGVIFLVVGLMEANEWGWTSVATLACLGAAPLFFLLFGWMSLKTPHPIVDFNLFRDRDFTAANLAILISQVIVMVTVLWAIYFQHQLHYTALETGILIFVATLPVLLMAPLGGYLSDAFGPRLPILIGFALLTFSLLWLLFMVPDHGQSLQKLLPGLLGFGCSLPLIMSPTYTLALSNVPSEKLGAAAGISMEIRQLASTVGMALVSAIYESEIHTTHSHERGFVAISLFASALALLGFFVALFTIKNTHK